MSTGAPISPPCPDPSAARSWPLRRLLPLTFAINTAIALFLALVTRWDLGATLVHAHGIGFSILLLNYLLHRWLLPHARTWVVAAVAIPLGCLTGSMIGSAYEGRPLLAQFTSGQRELLLTLATSGFFGLIVTAYFKGRMRLAEGEALLREEQLRRAADARALAEAELKLLQAQIEPHFLFNTLSNVVQLVDDDPPRARRMLLNLTSYLRGSLRRTRAGATTLGEELDLVRAYLEIQAVRMGGRLSFAIRCADGLRDHPLPPLVLQPLVENALRHGLEPKPGGGEVHVSAERDGDALVLEVRDDGVGLDPRRPAGVGLDNVRERVRALSGGRGGVTLRPGSPGGLCVRITLPGEAPAAAAAPPRVPGGVA